MELFANDARAVLNGSITNVATTLVVTSALRFPTTGDFALIVESELMLVTGVSGTTFTVTRGIEGTTAAAHPSGVAVALICSAGTLPRFLAAMRMTGTLANLPAAGYAGRTYQTTDSPYFFHDTGSAWLATESPIMTLPPAASSWTWVNQKTSTLQATRNDTYGMIHLFCPVDTADSMTMLVKAVPSVPYTCTFRIKGLQFETNYSTYGVVWRNSANGHFKSMQQLFNAAPAPGLILGISKGTTGNPAVSADYGNVFTRRAIEWYRFIDDNTNHKFEISVDGFNWIPMLTHARNTDVTPNTVGFYVNPRNSISAAAMASLVSYKES